MCDSRFVQRWVNILKETSFMCCFFYYILIYLLHNKRRHNINSIELILAIKEYAKRQGVDFEIALKMLGMMYEDGVHLDGGYDE